MNHAEARALGMQRLAAIENAAMRARFGIRITPQVRTEAANANRSAANVKRFTAHNQRIRSEALEFIKANPGCQTKQVADHVGYCRETARFHLGEMEAEGLITRRGPSSRSTWSLANG